MKRITPAYLVSDNSTVLCPTCGLEGWENNNVHLARVRVLQNHSETIVERETDRVRSVKKGSGRGSIVTVEFYCEANHRFDVEFSFHKGSVIATAIARDGEPDTELWRD